MYSKEPDESRGKGGESMSEYNAEKRRYWYLKYREKILKRQKEYDDAHRPQINKRMRNYYRKKCGLKPEN